MNKLGFQSITTTVTHLPRTKFSSQKNGKYRRHKTQIQTLTISEAMQST